MTIVGDQSQDVVNHDAIADGVAHIVAKRHDAPPSAGQSFAGDLALTTPV